MDLKYKKYIFKIMQQGNSEINNKEDFVALIYGWLAGGMVFGLKGGGRGVELSWNQTHLSSELLNWVFGLVPLTRFYPLNEKPLNNK